MYVLIPYLSRIRRTQSTLSLPRREVLLRRFRNAGVEKNLRTHWKIPNRKKILLQQDWVEVEVC